MATATDRRPLASQDEVAAYLGVPKRTVIDWRRRGIGPRGRKVGRHVRYRWADVERWFDEQP